MLKRNEIWMNIEPDTCRYRVCWAPPPSTPTSALDMRLTCSADNCDKPPVFYTTREKGCGGETTSCVNVADLLLLAV